MRSDQKNVRFITYQGNIYLRKEDIIEYIRELGSTEETDVRERLLQAALNLNKVQN